MLLENKNELLKINENLCHCFVSRQIKSNILSWLRLCLLSGNEVVRKHYFCKTIWLPLILCTYQAISTIQWAAKFSGIQVLCLSVKMNLISLKYSYYCISRKWDSVQASWNLNSSSFQSNNLYIKYHRWMFILDIITWRLILSENGIRASWCQHTELNHLRSYSHLSML